MGVGTLRRYHRVQRPAGYTPTKDAPEVAPAPEAPKAETPKAEPKPQK